jgi:hypothetical protein
MHLNKILFVDTGNAQQLESAINQTISGETANVGSLLVGEEFEENTQKILKYKNLKLKEVLRCRNVMDLGDDEIKKIAKRDFNKAILPIPEDVVSLRWVSGLNVSRIGEYYGLFRSLWKAGLKEVKAYNLNRQFKLNCSYILEDLVDIHKGRRCFVVGNGPSLNKINMGYLKDEITLGSNRCYLGFNDWGFNFPYWASMDRLQIERYTREWEENIPRETVKFYPFEYVELFNWENACPVNHHYDYPDFPNFSNDPGDIYLGNTVTYMLLQIAVIMGCNPIYLIGVDHRFPIKQELEKGLVGAPPVLSFAGIRERIKHPLKVLLGKDKNFVQNKDLWTASDSFGPTHFHSKYTKGHRKQEFVVPRTERATMAFQHAAIWAERHDREIYNATPGTALKAFSKVEFETLFK